MPRDRDPLVVGRVIGDVLDSFTKSINLSVSYNDREVSNGCERKLNCTASRNHHCEGGATLKNNPVRLCGQYMLSEDPTIEAKDVFSDFGSPAATAPLEDLYYENKWDILAEIKYK
nr:FT like protein [Tanacetum cinerariifolium]